MGNPMIFRSKGKTSIILFETIPPRKTATKKMRQKFFAGFFLQFSKGKKKGAASPLLLLT
jgi:hypothetical protein